MPGSNAASMPASCDAESISACGAQGTPQRTKCAFSVARSWHTATAAAPGATGREAASVASALAGTFSNSVVMAALHRASSASPAAS